MHFLNGSDNVLTMGPLVKDARGRSKYWIACYRAADGRRLKKSTKKTDRKQAEIILAAWEHAENMAAGGEATAERLKEVLSETLTRLGLAPIKTPSVKSWLEEWLKSKEGQVSASTHLSYRQVTREFLAFLGPAQALRRLDSIGVTDIERFVASLRADGRSGSTINKLVRKFLSAAFEKARKTGLIKFNPVMATTPERASALSRDTFTPEQVAGIVRAAKGTDWEGAILFAYGTGARLSDTANLRWSSLDTAAGVVTFEERKPGKLAIVGLHGDFLDWISSAKKLSEDPDAFVFPKLAGRTLSGQDGLSREFSGLVEKAGIHVRLLREGNDGKGRSLRALSFHSLRHGAASSVFNNAAIREIARRVTNHAPDGSLDRYLHKDLEAIREATKLIPRLPKGDDL
jgi:integrase